MKKKIIFFAILILFGIGAIVFAVSYNKGDKSNIGSEEISAEIIIKDDTFVMTINDIHANFREYDGKTISYEGIMYYNEDYRVVGRYYNCCAYDTTLLGLECFSEEDFPTENEWVRVEGTIKINKDNPYDIFPYIEVSKITVLEERGEEFVY